MCKSLGCPLPGGKKLACGARSQLRDSMSACHRDRVIVLVIIDRERVKGISFFFFSSLSFLGWRRTRDAPRFICLAPAYVARRVARGDRRNSTTLAGKTAFPCRNAGIRLITQVEKDRGKREREREGGRESRPSFAPRFSGTRSGNCERGCRLYYSPRFVPIIVRRHDRENLQYKLLLSITITTGPMPSYFNQRRINVKNSCRWIIFKWRMIGCDDCNIKFYMRL